MEEVHANHFQLDKAALFSTKVVQCAGRRFIDYYATRLSKGGLDLSNASSETNVSDDDNSAFEIDVEYLTNLDPKEWKDQDHYAVLGLKTLRIKATDDDLKRAYRKIVLIHHPDKRKAKGEEVKTDDDYFTCITRAYEILGNPVKRRAFDSVDPEFDDGLPSTSALERDYYGTCKKYFEMNARWSDKKRIPEFGDDSSSRDDVDKFYNFWYNFDSWREFSYLDEEDKDKGADRDERRWIEKQNKSIRAKRKKDENARIRSLVDCAYNKDPRIVRFKQEEKDKRNAQKRAKQDAFQAAKADEERAIKEVAAAKKAAEEAEKRRIETIRMEREQQKKYLKKEKKLFRDHAKAVNYFTEPTAKDLVKNMENVEKICEMLKLVELQDVNKRMQAASGNGKGVFKDTLRALEERLEEERNQHVVKPTGAGSGTSTSATAPVTPSSAVKSVDKSAMWNADNMQLLIKAVNLFPAGTVSRWDVIANYMNLHSKTASGEGGLKYQSKDVLGKAKDFNQDFNKSSLKSQANDNAFESFEKQRKDLKKVDPEDISVSNEVPEAKKKAAAAEAETKAKADKAAKPKGAAPMVNGKGPPKAAPAAAAETKPASTKPAAATEEKAATETEPTPAAAAEPTTTTPAEAKGTWSKEEQAILEQAIKTYPITTPDRWERIAECIPNRTKKDCLRRVKELVDLVNAKKEAQKIVYSSLYEMVVSFTRDYEEIRKALTTLEHYDKTCVENVLQGINDILTSTWGTQNYCQVLMVSDCGIGMRSSSVVEVVNGLIKRKQTNDDSYNWLPFACPSRINFCCLGNPMDTGFKSGTALYQNMLDYSGQPGKLFLPQCDDLSTQEASVIVSGMCQRICDANYRQFEATLNCGSYFKLESRVLIWPPPLPHKEVDMVGKETTRTIAKHLEICGFISISDIGSPMSISRHLVLPVTTNKTDMAEEDAEQDPAPPPKKSKTITYDLEKLDTDIKTFYAKAEATNSDDESMASGGAGGAITSDESMCVLLHGAFKVENMAALVLLNQNWYGFLYSWSDNKKKSNLMLMVLKPGTDVIPWLGDFRLLTTANDPAEKGSFPVKPDKRSYSQNCVSWIRQAGLQSDIQKVLRHAKKLPEKTQHFYKELNRIRKAALSLGFVELLDGLASIFEREISCLPANAHMECALQLKHASQEIRKLSNRDLKQSIVPYAAKF